jgi:hypothetical protein
MEKGYVVFENVIDRSEVDAIRDWCEQSPAMAGESELYASEFLQTPSLVGIPFRATVLEGIEKILGPGFTIYPNMTVRADRYTTWHVDNGFVPRYLETSAHLWEEAFLHAQCVIYLQDNDPKKGGGLDVIPGTHRHDLRLGGGVKEMLAMMSLPGVSKPQPILAKAGDLILFDGRLAHRGTPAVAAPEAKKFGIFWSASRSNAIQIDEFMRYLGSRSSQLRRETKTVPEFMLKRYDDLRTIAFPESYLPDTVEAINQHDINIASFAGGRYWEAS